MIQKHILIISFVLMLAAVISMGFSSSQHSPVEALSKDTNKFFFNDKPIISVARAPSQRYEAFFYHPNDKTTEEINLVIHDIKRNRFQEVYYSTFASWDVTGDIHWLGNEHVFFKRHCGTSCQGLTLLNIATRSRVNAVLSYPPFPHMPERTHFKDWFGAEYEMDGLVANVSSKTNDNIHYLIFSLEDYEKNNMGQKRFLFTGDGLIEVE